MPFCLMHDYGKWSKLKHGKKTRACKKCGKKKTKNATAWDQFWCSHRKRKNRSRKGTILYCIKCDKQWEKG